MSPSIVRFLDKDHALDLHHVKMMGKAFDKATMELVARGAGVLRARMLNEGQTAAVGTVIGVIAGADEDVAALTGGASKPAAAKKSEAASDAAEEKPTSFKIVWAQGGPITNYHAGDTLLIDDIAVTAAATKAEDAKN